MRYMRIGSSMCDSGLPFFRQMLEIVVALDDDIDRFVLKRIILWQRRTRRPLRSRYDDCSSHWLAVLDGCPCRARLPGTIAEALCR